MINDSEKSKSSGGGPAVEGQAEVKVPGSRKQSGNTALGSQLFIEHEPFSDEDREPFGDKQL